MWFPRWQEAEHLEAELWVLEWPVCPSESGCWLVSLQSSPFRTFVSVMQTPLWEAHVCAAVRLSSWVLRQVWIGGSGEWIKGSRRGLPHPHLWLIPAPSDPDQWDPSCLMQGSLCFPLNLEDVRKPDPHICRWHGRYPDGIPFAFPVSLEGWHVCCVRNSYSSKTMFLRLILIQAHRALEGPGSQSVFLHDSTICCFLLIYF